MHHLLASLATLLCCTCLAQESPPPISPAEALQRIDQEVTVLMQVKSTGGNTARFLNSQTDFRNETNFAIFIPNLALASFKEAGIADPGEYYKGKTILASGTVTISQGRPILRADKANQIKLVNSPQAAPATTSRTKKK